MSSGTVRLLLVWLIAAVLPLKGLAAAGVMGCPAHQHAAVTGTAAGVQAPAALHVHDAASHAAKAEAGVKAPSDAADPSSTSAAASESGLKVNCSACAPCCAAAAPASDPPRLPEPRPAMAAAAFVAAAYAGVDADVPHRPPRRLLA